MPALTPFLINTVERNDRSHSMRAQQIHHSNNEGDCDSNCASDADVDFDRDDNGRQHGLKPFVFSGQLSFSNFDGRRIASASTADCIRDWTVISDGGKPHTVVQDDDGDCDSNSASDADVDFDRDDNGRQHRLKPFVFSGQLSFSNFDGCRIASGSTADCTRAWRVFSDGGKPHTAFQEQNEITAIGPHRRPESPGEQAEETSTHCDAGEGY